MCCALECERKGAKMDIDNGMRDKIIKEIGVVPLSETQQIRVLVVQDQDTGEIKLSAQKWWRRGLNYDWVIGKGFRLDKHDGMRLGGLMKEGAWYLQHLDNNMFNS